MSEKFQLVVFTNNAHKLGEIRQILSSIPYKVLGYKDVFNFEVDVVEDGITFEDNALKKVQALPELPNTIFLAEDSGLEIEALDGRPGVFSSRYGGDISTKEKCLLILKELEGCLNRRARFRTVIAVRFSREDVVLCNGVVEGVIALSFRGEKGFGYDPIFIPSGFDLTFGEMSSEQKHSLSHRGKALERVSIVLKEH